MKTWQTFGMIGFITYAFLVLMFSLGVTHLLMRKAIKLTNPDIYLSSLAFGLIAGSVTIYLCGILKVVGLTGLLLWLFIVCIAHYVICVSESRIRRIAFYSTILLISTYIYIYITLSGYDISIYEIPEIYLLYLPTLVGMMIEGFLTLSARIDSDAE